MALEEKIKWAKDNYDTLLKAKHDKGEFVLIAEKDEGGSYNTDIEGLGVTKEGDLVWVYCSGCSCSGYGDMEVLDKTAKVLMISKNKTAEDFFKEHECDPRESNYCEY